MPPYDLVAYAGGLVYATILVHSVAYAPSRLPHLRWDIMKPGTVRTALNAGAQLIELGTFLSQ